MSVLCFVDTNILLYAHDRDAGIKSKRSAELLSELWESETGVLSVQVLQEFYVHVTQKIPTPIAKAKAREVVRLYGAWLQTLTPVESVLRASEISEIWQLSFWDSLIIAAAEQVSAAVVLSEDLQHGQTIGGVRIINPLLSSEPLEQLIQ